MTALITNGEIVELQALYPYLEIRPLTKQMEHAVLLFIRGMSITAAARGAGYNDTRQLKKWLDSEEGEAVMGYVRDKHLESVNVTREQLTRMLFEAHAKAATATEEIAAIREIGKMNDLYENEKRKGAVNVQINNTQNITNEKQLERMSTEELLQLAGPKLPGALGNHIYEGELAEPPLHDNYDEDLDV